MNLVSLGPPERRRDASGERIWLVTFVHYDLGYFDDETCRLEPIENPFGPKCYHSARIQLPPLRSEWTGRDWLLGLDSTSNPPVSRRPRKK